MKNNNFLKSSFVALAGTLSLTGACVAQTINWGNTPGDLNFDSKGNPLTADAYDFEFGVFNDGFQPVEANTMEWLDNWKAVDSAEYNEKATYFSSNWAASSEDAALAGKQAFILIHRKLDATGSLEIFLASSRNWKIPSYVEGPNAALPVDWRLSTATTVISGASPKLADAAIELQRFDSKAAKAKTVVALVSSTAGFLLLTGRRRSAR